MSLSISHGLIDNCAVSRLVLVFMEYYFMTGVDTYAPCKCPMVCCRTPFTNARDMIIHLKTCERLFDGVVRCPACREINRYPIQSKKDCSWTSPKPPIQERFSQLARRWTPSNGRHKSGEHSISWFRPGPSPPGSGPFNADAVGKEKPSVSLTTAMHTDHPSWAPHGQHTPSYSHRE